MSIKNLLMTAVSSLKFHKLRTFLTMIGIIIGISSVVTILSVGDGFKEYVHEMSSSANANDITVVFTPKDKENSTAIDFVDPFTKGDLNSIKSISGVANVKPSAGPMGIGNMVYGEGSFYNKTVNIFLDKYEGVNQPLEYGRWFNEGDKGRNNIVLEYSIAKEISTNPKDILDKAITIKGENFQVIGITKNKGEDTMSFMDLKLSYIGEEALKEIKGEEKVYSIDVTVEEGFEKKKVFDEVQKLLKANHGNLQGEYTLQDPQESIKVIDGIIGALTKFVAFITSISLVVGGIGVMNIMYVSVSERKREIGIRRAIGASPRSILMQFLIEAVLVTLMGGIVGILLGFLVSQGAGVFMPFKPVLTLSTIIGATIVSILEGIIFGVIPARNACKMDPIKAIYR